ncbi:hypothetical protein QQF64_002843 [Cirrhinus molitorella]|uniref:Uncharacterized protein n=1 Tax=Cirrhinus molitorella TaxID=172907 RepID=A0ABR3MRA1_9TELE
MLSKDTDRITVVVENTTDEEVTLTVRTVLGWLHAADAIHTLEVKPPPLTEHQPKSSQFNKDLPPETLPRLQESEEWDPPVDLNHSPEEQQEHVRQLLRENSGVFAKDDWDTGCIWDLKMDIVCVRKKDGSLRLCVDYRLLNEKTHPDRHPIPRIQEILENL